MIAYTDWLDEGVRAGWVKRFCAMHDSPPHDARLIADVEAGLDPCIPAVVLLPEVTP